MKLGELKALIRKTKGNPTIAVPFGNRAMSFQVMKGPLLEELDRAYPGGKAIETGLSFDEDSGDLSVATAPGDEVVNALKVSESFFDLDDDDILV